MSIINVRLTQACSAITQLSHTLQYPTVADTVQPAELSELHFCRFYFVYGSNATSSNSHYAEPGYLSQYSQYSSLTTGWTIGG